MPPPDDRLAVLCVNGPNLDRLGRRDPAVYGSTTLAELEELVKGWGESLQIEVRFLQVSHEGDLVQAVNEAEDVDALVINPGALTHTSMALHDAVEACAVPVVEVHISNVRGRDRWRRRSLVAPVAMASLFGRGILGYQAALSTIRHRRRWDVETIRYGPHPDQVIDVRRASGGPGSAVLVHGGFWLDVWGRDIVEGWAVALAEGGISTANIEYRRLGSGGGGVATVSDVAEATTLAASMLSGPPLVVVGHSAGAHLAALATAGTDVDLAGFVAVGGVYDLDAPGASSLGAGAVADFQSRGGASAAPHDSLPRPVLLHGADDTVVPTSQSSGFARALAAAGHEVVFREMDGVRHFDFLDTGTTAWEKTRDEVERLLIG